MTSKIPGNGHTLAKIAQKLDDHIENQTKQFGDIDKRLDEIEVDVKVLLTEKSTAMAKGLKTLLPVIVSLLIVGGGWVWGLSRQESKIAELEGGRYENKGNIAMIAKQLQDMYVADATRDARYEAILEKLNLIQKEVERLHRKTNQ